MTRTVQQPEIRGTRAGYVIRFTCPACAAEDIIVIRTRADHFRPIHPVTCRHCRARSTVRTPPAREYLTGGVPVPTLDIDPATMR